MKLTQFYPGRKLGGNWIVSYDSLRGVKQFQHYGDELIKIFFKNGLWRVTFEGMHTTIRKRLQPVLYYKSKTEEQAIFAAFRLMKKVSKKSDKQTEIRKQQEVKKQKRVSKFLAKPKLTSLKGRFKNSVLDEIGEYLNNYMNKHTSAFKKLGARKIAEKKYGKALISKFSTSELRHAWFQYEPH